MLPAKNVGVEPREEKDFGIIGTLADLLWENGHVPNALQKRSDRRMALEDVSAAFIGEFHRLPQDRWVLRDGHAMSLYIGTGLEDLPGPRRP